eukprot:augustus_masked-scaffold_39-processed-gene-0.25-mRNA-1 protein AED:0.44 eAED:0.44 QI:0/-1/0/1/-1/1/1/0/1075
MLGCPIKKTKTALWAPPLRDYIAKTYGDKAADEQTESLSRLSSSREWVAGLSQMKEFKPENLTKMENYLRMLGILEARFPIEENAVNIVLVWYDSLKPTKKFNYTKLAAEKAHCLFNYAALHSYAGMHQNRGTPDGLINACKHFIQSARYFTYLKDEFVPKNDFGPLTSDLRPEGLQMLTNMMLAQAQACYFEKALKNKLSSSILSKLAAGTFQLYENALKASETAHLKSVLDPTWGQHFSFQRLCFLASAIFQHSKVVLQSAEKTGEGYGNRIAYLKWAIEKCDEAIYLIKNTELSDSLLGTVDQLRAAVSRDLKKAEEDNKNIYLDLVPPLNTLEKPTAQILARTDGEVVDITLVAPVLPTSLEGKEDMEDLASMFKNLLPPEVQMAVAMFQSRVQSLIEALSKETHDKDSEIKAALEGANLPGAIESSDAQFSGLPEPTWEKLVNHVQQYGGKLGLLQAVNANKNTAQQLGNILQQIDSLLAQEETEDQNMRNKWGGRWTIPASSSANSLLKNDSRRFKGYLTEAASSDQLLENKINGELSAVLDNVSKPRQVLDEMIPDPGDIDDDPNVEEYRSNLRMSYITLQSSLQTALSKLDKLVEQISGSDIVSEIFSKGADMTSIVADETNLNSLIDNKLAEFEEPTAALRSILEKQNALLSRVLDDRSKYMESRLENEKTRERESLLNMLDHGVNEYLKVKKHVEDGQGFYANVAEKVQNLLRVVGEFVQNRKAMATNLDSNLSQGFAVGGIGAGVVQPGVVTAGNGHAGATSQLMLGNTLPRNFTASQFSSQHPNDYLNQGLAGMMGTGATLGRPAAGASSYSTPGAVGSTNFVSQPSTGMNTISQPATTSSFVSQPTISSGFPQVGIPNSGISSPAPTTGNIVSTIPANSGSSLYEEMKRAQEEADKNGVTQYFTGESGQPTATAPPPTSKGNTAEDDAAAFRLAEQMRQQDLAQQQEMLLSSYGNNATKKINDLNSRDFTKEISQMKIVLGSEASEEDLKLCLHATDGNVDRAVNMVLEGNIPRVNQVKKKNKKGGLRGLGLFGRKNRKGSDGAAPATNNTTANGGNNTQPW